jgi:hypothetical protein
VGDWHACCATTRRLLALHCSLVAPDDDTDATGTDGLLALDGPGMVHHTIVSGPGVVLLALTRSTPSAPWQGLVSNTVVVPLAILPALSVLHLNGL